MCDCDVTQYRDDKVWNRTWVCEQYVYLAEKFLCAIAMKIAAARVFVECNEMPLQQVVSLMPKGGHEPR